MRREGPGKMVTARSVVTIRLTYHAASRFMAICLLLLSKLPVRDGLEQLIAPRIRFRPLKNAMDISVTDYIGLAGSALIVVVYFLNLRELLLSTDWRFPALNLAGASLILFSLLFAWNLPSALIEIFWIAISADGLIRAARGLPREDPDK